MKQHLLKLALLATLAATPTAHAQLNIPSDGSDGVFAPTTNVVIDLRLATFGQWDTNNSANPGFGVYDWEKWAIIFKYQSVFIPTGVTVTFKNHGSRAPVVWLVQSNVIINGTLNLDGGNESPGGAEGHINIEGGPGGFRGAANLLGGAHGLGPVGAYRLSYGNPQILPLIGGGGMWSGANRGAGGGGAILLAAAQPVLVNGLITANGGVIGTPPRIGGGVRVITPALTGTGKIRANPDGRIRIEASTFSMSQATEPEQIAVPPGPTPQIWPAPDAPTARIISIAGQNAPLDPRSPLVGFADLVIQTNAPTVVLIETKNFPIEGGANSVKVRLMPKYDGSSTYAATRVSGSYTQALWSATIPFVPGYSTLQVRAVAP
jgi:hypothetical protein